VIDSFTLETRWFNNKNYAGSPAAPLKRQAYC
jgi:hypothetical protein